MTRIYQMKKIIVILTLINPLQNLKIKRNLYKKKLKMADVIGKEETIKV